MLLNGKICRNTDRKLAVENPLLCCQSDMFGGLDNIVFNAVVNNKYKKVPIISSHAYLS